MRMQRKSEIGKAQVDVIKGGSLSVRRACGSIQRLALCASYLDEAFVLLVAQITLEEVDGIDMAVIEKNFIVQVC